jgi:DNA-directed RNA polymerase specialized sigma24 family protein
MDEQGPALNRMRWSRRRPVVQATMTGERAPAGDPAAEEFAARRLSGRQRIAVDLYYFVDLDVATIAEVMGWAPGTVKATLHQARARLRDLLGDADD